MPPTLAGQRVTLRPPRPADIDQRLALGRHPEIVRMLGGSTNRIAPMTRDQADAFIERLAGHPCAWVIEHETRFVGDLRLDSIDATGRTAALAIALYDIALLGRGLGTEAVRLALAHAFDTLALHRLTVRVLADNRRAIRCYARCGFTIERRERATRWIDGAWHDHLVMARRAPGHPEP